MILISGDFTYQVRIHCQGCGRSHLSRHRTRVQQVDTQELTAELERQFNNTVVDIPIGWTSNGRLRNGDPDVTCKECTGG